MRPGVDRLLVLRPKRCRAGFRVVTLGLCRRPLLVGILRGGVGRGDTVGTICSTMLA